MAHSHVDKDGTLYEHGRSGELVPVVPASEPSVPATPWPAPGLCEDHAEPYGYAGPTCPDCISETLAGERPRKFVGRRYRSPTDTPDFRNDEPTTTP